MSRMKDVDIARRAAIDEPEISVDDLRQLFTQTFGTDDLLEMHKQTVERLDEVRRELGVLRSKIMRAVELAEVSSDEEA